MAGLAASTRPWYAAGGRHRELPFPSIVSQTCRQLSLLTRDGVLGELAQHLNRYWSGATRTRQLTLP